MSLFILSIRFLIKTQEKKRELRFNFGYGDLNSHKVVCRPARQCSVRLLAAAPVALIVGGDEVPNW
jgi:hypothetical protein